MTCIQQAFSRVFSIWSSAKCTVDCTVVTFGNALAVLAVSVHFSRGQDVAKQAILGSSHLHSGRRPCLSTVRESVWRILFSLDSSLGSSLDVGEAVFVSMGPDGERRAAVVVASRLLGPRRMAIHLWRLFGAQSRRHLHRASLAALSGND